MEESFGGIVMAGQGNRQSTAKRKTTNTAGRNNTRTSSGHTQTGRSSSTSRQKQTQPMDLAIRNEILLIVLAALAVILFLCNFGVVGKAGNAVSDVMFGVFGLTAYIAPVIIFLMIAFGMSNIGSRIANRKLVAGAGLFLLISMICEFFSANPALAESYQFQEIYTRCSEHHNGGGILAGSLAYLSCKFLGMVGTVLAILVLAIICLVVVTEKSFIGGVARQGRRVYERSMEDAAYRKERARERREAQEEKGQEWKSAGKCGKKKKKMKSFCAWTRRYPVS